MPFTTSQLTVELSFPLLIAKLNSISMKTVLFSSIIQLRIPVGGALTLKTMHCRAYYSGNFSLPYHSKEWWNHVSCKIYSDVIIEQKHDNHWYNAIKGSGKAFKWCFLVENSSQLLFHNNKANQNGGAISSHNKF